MDLATNYLGLHLRSPIVPSAGPMTESPDTVKRMEDAGAAAIVFHSLFEEQLQEGRHDFFSRLNQGAEDFAEPLPVLFVRKISESVRSFSSQSVG